MSKEALGVISTVDQAQQILLAVIVRYVVLSGTVALLNGKTAKKAITNEKVQCIRASTQQC